MNPQQNPALPRDANGNAVPPQSVARDANGNPLPQTGAAASAKASVTPFAMLDTGNKGAVKLDQAMNDPWLKAHFQQCDANHNNEVTSSEYATCSTTQ
jgi:hypothetical protein